MKYKLYSFRKTSLVKAPRSSFSNSIFPFHFNFQHLHTNKKLKLKGKIEIERKLCGDLNGIFIQEVFLFN